MIVPVSKTITIATSGTPQPVFTGSEASAHPVVAIMIQPQTGTALVGDSSISYTASPRKGYTIAAGSSFTINPAADAIALHQCYIDASANGAVINVLYFQRVSR